MSLGKRVGVAAALLTLGAGAWAAISAQAQTSLARPAVPVTGKLSQGGWIRGQVPSGTVSLMLDGEVVPLDKDGRFFAAFDRDAANTARLSGKRAGGSSFAETLAIAPRAWNIEHINAAKRPSMPSETFLKIRAEEYEKINASRKVNADSDGWRQDFIWPATGRISGRFGSQRIYRGEPGSYHSGLDIAAGAGKPFVAPADGVVVLAAEEPFTLEGHLLIVDHGMGLNSAFLHCSKLAVKVGDRVTQGQYLGNVGSTGRATGPHLHWGIKWRDARLDPLLFVGPMQ